jgi:hypothetical protein
MLRHIRSTLGSTLALAAILSAGACGKKNDAPNDTTRVSTGSMDTTAPSLRVSDLSLGKSIGADKKIKDGEGSFSPRDTIYASVTTNGSAPSATLVARWMFQDGQLVQEQQQTVAPTGGDAVTEFHISKPSGWPKGKYTLHVLLNGAQVQAKDFEVK